MAPSAALHEATENNQLHNGQPEYADAREDEQHSTGAQNGDQDDPHATAQSEAGSHPVGQETANGTGEKVHQAEQRCDQTSDELLHTKLVLQVAGHAVVDIQLHAEAAGVVGDQNPNNIIAAHLLQTLTEGASGAANQLPVVPVAFRAVVREKPHADGNDDPYNSGNLQRHTPSRVVVQSHCLEHLVQTRGCGLGDTTSEVAPTTSHGVGLSDDSASEHLSAPELAGNESRTHASNQSSGNVDTTSVGDGGGTGQGRRGEEQQKSHASSTTKSVAGRTNENTGEDCG